jgi:hypothetical protein
MRRARSCRDRETGASPMNTQWKTAIFVTVLFFAAPAIHAQTHASTATTTGTVEGKVFAVTRGGDLKPARMPTIYLFYKGPGENLEANSADDHYQNALIAAFTETTRRSLAAARAGSFGDEGLECRENLLDTDRSLANTAQWALDKKKVQQVLMTDGDEEGHFRIAKVPVGRYRLVARGQAGANDAYWESSIVVKAGVATTAKLTSPGKSCLRVE